MIDDQNSPRICDEFPRIFLDGEKRPARSVLRERGWRCVPIADFINPTEANWIAGAINTHYSREAIGISYEFVGECDEEVLSVSESSIIEFFASNSHKYCAITSSSYSFLVFKDQLNRYFLLCGSELFLASAYKSNIQIAKKMFIGEWTQQNNFTRDEKRFLESTWQYYVD